MKPVVYVGLAVLLYAATNLVLEQKLSKFHSSIILLYAYPVMLIMTVMWCGRLKMCDPQTKLPTSTLIPVLAGTAIAWFFADFFFIGAYHKGANMITVTTIFSLLPVFGAFLKYVWTRETPTIYHVIGWLMASAAVILVTKGELIRKTLP